VGTSYVLTFNNGTLSLAVYQSHDTGQTGDKDPGVQSTLDNVKRTKW